MNNNLLRIAATFMISLVLTLPFYTSSVFAVSDIRKDAVWGDQTKINSYFGSTDTMIEGTVLAVIKDNSDLTQILGPTEHSQVKLGYGNNFPDSTMCTKIGQIAEGENIGYYNYTCEVDPSFISISSNPADGPYGPLKFGLFDTEGVLLAKSNAINFAVDTTPPKSVIKTISSTNMSAYTTDVDHLSVDYAIGKNNNLTGTYDVTDYSGYADGTRYRAGVKSVKLMINNQGMVMEDEFTRRNVATGNINFNAFDWGDEGNNTICLLGKDALDNQEDQAGDNCKTFFIDVSPPSIYYNEVVILDQNNRHVDFLKPGHHYGFTVIANISDDDSDGKGVGFLEDDIKMNLVAVGGAADKVVFRDASPLTCDKDPDTEMKSTCTWDSGRSFTAPDGPVELQLSIYGTDSVGNDMEPADSTANLQEDGEIPMLTGLWNVVDNVQTTFVGKNFPNTIVAVITDTGAGVNKDTVTATFGTASNGLHKKVGNTESYEASLNPDVCTEAVQGTYNCIWYNMTCPSSCQSTEILEINLNITDTAGNSVKNITELAKDFTAPSTVPVPDGEEASVTVITDGGDHYYRSSNLFQFSFKVFDEGSGYVLAAGDFNSFSQRASDSNPIECAAISSEPGNYTCVWTQVQPKGQAFNGNIIFNTTDLLGNFDPEVITASLDVLLDENAPPDFYEEPLEGVVNKDYLLPIYVSMFEKSSSLYPTYPIFFNLKYNGLCNQDKVGILEISTICDGLQSTAYEYPVDYLGKMSNNNYEGIFSVPLSESLLSGIGDHVDFNCTFRLWEYCGNKFYTQEEEVAPVQFSVPLIARTSTDEDNMLQEIDAIKKKYGEAAGWKLVGTLQSISDTLSTVCSVKTKISAVMSIIVGIGAVFGGICDVPVIRAASMGACDGIMGGMDATQTVSLGGWDTFSNFADSMCAVVGCSHSDVSIAGSSYDIGGGWCDDLQPFFAMTGYSTLELAQRSYVFSALCGCLPGLVYNLNQIRQDNCFKGYCYQEYTQMGVPKSECDRQYKYLNCVHTSWLGQLTAILNIFNFQSIILDAMQNPLTYVWTAIKWPFKIGCYKPGWATGSFLVKWFGSCTPYQVMIWTESVALAVNLLDTGDFFGDAGQQQKLDYCELLMDGSTAGYGVNNYGGDRDLPPPSWMMDGRERNTRIKNAQQSVADISDVDVDDVTLANKGNNMYGSIVLQVGSDFYFYHIDKDVIVEFTARNADGTFSGQSYKRTKKGEWVEDVAVGNIEIFLTTTTTTPTAQRGPAGVTTTAPVWTDGEEQGEPEELTHQRTGIQYSTQIYTVDGKNYRVYRDSGEVITGYQAVQYNPITKKYEVTGNYDKDGKLLSKPGDDASKDKEDKAKKKDEKKTSFLESLTDSDLAQVFGIAYDFTHPNAGAYAITKVIGAGVDQSKFKSEHWDSAGFWGHTASIAELGYEHYFCSNIDSRDSSDLFIPDFTTSIVSSGGGPPTAYPIMNVVGFRNEYYDPTSAVEQGLIDYPATDTDPGFKCSGNDMFICYPDTSQKVTWLPNATSEVMDYPIPRGYLYQFEYMVPHKYTAAQIENLDPDFINDIGLEPNGSIKYDIIIYQSENFATGKVNGVDIGQKAVLHRQIEPDETPHHVFITKYLKTYLDRICIKFDTYKYDGVHTAYPYKEGTDNECGIGPLHGQITRPDQSAVEMSSPESASAAGDVWVN